MDEQNGISKKDEQLLRIAALACLEREEEEDQSFASSPDYVPVDPAWVAGMTWRLSHKAGKKKKHIRLRRVVALAAIMVLVLGAATVSADPKGFAELFADDHRQYSTVWGDSGVVLEKPDGWKSKEYPVWAPKGFYIGEIINQHGLDGMTLQNKETGRTIVFAVHQGASINYANTEELESYEVSIAGQMQTVYTDKEGKRLYLTIVNGDDTIFIDGAITVEELGYFVENIKNLK